MLTLREDTDGGAAKYQASSRSRSHPQIRSEREGVIIGLAMTHHYDSSLVVVYEVDERELGYHWPSNLDPKPMPSSLLQKTVS